MPRRRPAEVRADGPHPLERLFRAPHDVLPYLSPGGVATVARYERTRHSPGAVAYAWRRWYRYALAEPRRCQDPECLRCYRTWDENDARVWRAVLEGAVCVMPPRDARAWRRRLRELDELAEPEQG